VRWRSDHPLSSGKENYFSLFFVLDPMSFDLGMLVNWAEQTKFSLICNKVVPVSPKIPNQLLERERSMPNNDGDRKYVNFALLPTLAPSSAHWIRLHGQSLIRRE
jgi:hypothetical protein